MVLVPGDKITNFFILKSLLLTDYTAVSENKKGQVGEPKYIKLDHFRFSITQNWSHDHI
jgi:hypothetical protein